MVPAPPYINRQSDSGFTVHGYNFMFCPSCGSEERQMSQYCRACGTDLRPVRVSLERPDSVTASAVTAREEIGRAVAEKIRDMEGSRDLKRVAEDILPHFEKFLESPEEKRLRRMRAGVITAASGLGITLLSFLVFLAVVDSIGPARSMLISLSAGLGMLIFLVGLGLVLNGQLFSKPHKGLKDKSSDAEAQSLLDRDAPLQLRPAADKPESFRSPATSDLARVEQPSSVTEHTTHLLKPER
jgi:hypothetical protein